MKFQLYREQQLHCNIETAWSFFSSPVNLAKITPPYMGFTILSGLPASETVEGMVIEYRVSPILGIPLKWVTRIKQVTKNESFTDFQEKGPYKFWNHFHQFIPNETGVLMKDTIDYELPFGIFGNIAHKLFVRRQLENIFNYRYQILSERFNQKHNI